MQKNRTNKENINKAIPKLARVRLALSGSSTHAVAVIKQGNSLFNKQQTARVEDAEINSAITLFDKRQMAHGFTLIELLVVILIIGILAAVALPQYQIAVGKARVNRVFPVLRSIVNAQDAYFLANGTYSETLDNLDVTVKNEGIAEQVTDRTSYKGVNEGTLHVYNNTRGVVWSDNKHIVINFYYSPNQIACYELDETGSKICKALSNGQRGDGNLLLITP